MLAGALFGIYVASAGLRESHTTFAQSMRNSMFAHAKPSPRMRRLIIVWAVIMIVGLILAGAGIATAN